MDKPTRHILLGVILLVGAALRVIFYWDFSLSNDELSALSRLNFNSFHDLMQQGVRIDGHPAGTQVLLYYLTKYFGDSVAMVRLPFVLAGTLAIWYVYRIGRAWHSVSAGLLMAACFATLEFPLLYSRIARPYGLGMLFATMAMYHWVRVVRGSSGTKNLVMLAISLALCAYTHYFCGLTAAMLAFTGMLMLKGDTLRDYLYAMAGAIVLFLPHLSITLYQLSIGGVAWIGVPENDWIWGHLRYIMNDSYTVMAVLPLIGLVGWGVFRPQRKWTNIVLPLCFFLTPLIIGFFYSKYVSPVLQHSVLLFSFPFLLAFVFAGWDDTKPTLTIAAISLLLGVGLYSTVHERKFFQTEHFGVFKELAFTASDWKREHGRNVLLVADVNHPSYLNYYLKRTETPELKFHLYRVTDEGGLFRLKALMEHSKSEFLAYAWSTVNQNPEVERVIREKYPIRVKTEVHFNSAITLFKKGEVLRNVLSVFPFKRTAEWNCDTTHVQLDSVAGAWIMLDSVAPYGPTYMVPLDRLAKHGWASISVYVEAKMPNAVSDIQMVFEQVSGEDRYAWESRPFSAQLPPNDSGWAVFNFTLQPSKGQQDVIKLYPWTASGDALKLVKMEVRGVR